MESPPLDVSLIVFALAIVTFILDLGWQYYWAGRIGPVRAKNLTIAAFKNVETAAEIKIALDIPTQESMDKQTAVIRQSVKSELLVQLVEVREDLNQVKAELEKATSAEIPPIEFDEDALALTIGRVVKGAMGRELQLERKELEDLLQEYQESDQAVTDNSQTYQILVDDFGIPPGAAELALKHGPKAVRMAAEHYAPLQGLLGWEDGPDE